ncbi:uncharacterized protein P884DRAFT_75693 [Thermothelomyces heterothallicus CBS 202.75]|uniref:uncharacterized protein n=1 Tax=Thermothelomyces heterothallicus CBS 202.75 TaxID=1149848 RepID=UPI00374410D8
MMMLRPGRRHGIASLGVSTRPPVFAAIFNFFFCICRHGVPPTDTNIHTYHQRTNQPTHRLTNPTLTALGLSTTKYLPFVVIVVVTTTTITVIYNPSSSLLGVCRR